MEKKKILCSFLQTFFFPVFKSQHFCDLTNEMFIYLMRQQLHVLLQYFSVSNTHSSVFCEYKLKWYYSTCSQSYCCKLSYLIIDVTPGALQCDLLILWRYSTKHRCVAYQNNPECMYLLYLYIMSVVLLCEMFRGLML